MCSSYKWEVFKELAVTIPICPDACTVFTAMGIIANVARAIFFFTFSPPLIRSI